MADPGAQPAVADPAAAAAAAAAEAEGGESKSRKNRVKKLKAQYLSILELEARAAGGELLDAQQTDKLGRKAEVAAELEELGTALPEPAPRAAARGAGGGGGGLATDISQAEVEAAMQAILGGGQRRRPAGALRPALALQYSLQEANPGYSYFITLPDPLPDMGVSLSDPVGAMFFETMRPRAEAGEPRAVRMMFEQLKQSAQQAGLPAMQVRLQLIAEYGIDPITEQPVPGSPEEQLAWLARAVPAAERKAAERQLEQAAAAMMQGGGRGGRQRRR